MRMALMNLIFLGFVFVSDDFSLSLSDLEVSQKDDDFGSTLSLDSDQLDLDLM